MTQKTNKKTTTDSSFELFKSTVKHENLNDNQETDMYYAFSADEARTQFGEIFEFEFYKKGRIKKDMVVVDIGAAMGLASLYFKDGAKHIYACEPNLRVFSSAVKNTENYKNITCFPFGIAGTTRKATLYGYDNAEPATTEKRDNVTSEESVNLMAIDKFFEINKITHCDLLKIDCEGCEYEIFSSPAFKEVAPKIDYIIGEAHLQPPYYPMFIPEMLKEYGFKTEWLSNINLYRKLIINLPDGDTKTYTAEMKTLFFAHR